jgi:hypothetical protein
MTDKNLEMIVQTFDGFVAKRCAGKQRKAKVALLLANMNWNAYNNFGGRSNYIHPVCIYAETAVLFLWWKRQFLVEKRSLAKTGWGQHIMNRFKTLRNGWNTLAFRFVSYLTFVSFRFFRLLSQDKLPEEPTMNARMELLRYVDPSFSSYSAEE